VGQQEWPLRETTKSSGIQVAASYDPLPRRLPAFARNGNRQFVNSRQLNKWQTVIPEFRREIKDRISQGWSASQQLPHSVAAAYFFSV
jgi:hypothetical protein